MSKLSFIILVIVTLVSTGIFSCKEKPDSEDILDAVVNAKNSMKEVKGEFEFQFSSPVPGSDFLTTHYKSSFHLKRIPTDTVVGWFFEADNEDLLGDMSYRSNYDGNELVNFINKDSTVEISPPSDVKSSFIYGLVFEKIYRTVDLYLNKAILNDSTFTKKTNSWLIGNISMLPDTIVDGKNCFLFKNIKQNYDPETGVEYSNTERLVIDKKTYFPIYLETHFQRKENNEPHIDQKCRYVLRNLSFNDKISEVLFDKGKITYSTSRKNNDLIIPLSEGVKAPEWNLVSLTGDSIALNSLDEEVTIIKFGYVGCGACLLTTAELIKTYNKFQPIDKIGFYYINPIDNRQRSQSYVDKSNIPFQYLLANEKIISDYGLNTYPKIFVINRNRRIHKIFDAYTGQNMNHDIYNSILEITE